LTRELIESKRKNIVSYVVLFVSLGIVILPILSLIFPALIVSLTTQFPDETVDPFEFGVLFPTFLVANLILLGIFILYHTKKLPKLIDQSIKFIFNFEVSKRISILVILVLLSVYVAFSSPELAEENWPDFYKIELNMEGWPYEDTFDLSTFTLPVFESLYFVSANFFQNIKFVPFVASISLVFLTYLFTVQITKKRFAGLVAMAIVLQSQTFLSYDTTPTYPNYWTLFFILSLYLITKRWQLSAVSYVLSIFSKPLTILFLPFILFFTYRANIPRKQKILTVLSYGVIIVIGVVAIFLLETDLFELSTRDYSNTNNLWRGFGVLGFMFGLDSMFLIFLIPLILGLFILSRKGVVLADAVMLLIVGVLLSAPLSVFGGHHVYPYRLIPFIVFFAVGVGTLLSSKLVYKSKQGP